MAARSLACGTLLGLLAATGGPGAAARVLSFHQRVEAQRTIELVYYSHQTGASRSFDQAVPQALLEKKVRTYLKQSAALERLWKTPVTAQALRAELDRIAAQTRQADRLSELYDALGNDPFLIQECLARPVLADRLSRSFFASDERIHGRRPAGTGPITWDGWWRDVEGTFDERTVPAVATAGGSLPAPTRRAAAAADPASGGCVEEDGWDDGLRYDVPGGRLFHSAVWTGTSMIVWGGLQTLDPEEDTDTGARYDPVTDTWSPVSVVGAPPPTQKFDHAVTWTGHEMIVMSREGKAARYDPVSDTWRPVSPLGAPIPSSGHSAVWTGHEMIVWGGEKVTCGGPCTFEQLDRGARYDPDTDTWTPISTTGAPSARSTHKAIWTGREMLVWGGFDGVGAAGSGGRYDPATDTWHPMSSAGAPSNRGGQIVLWTGDVMFVLGLANQAGTLMSGGLYDPDTDTWASVAPFDAHTERFGPAVWTGQEMILWLGPPSGGVRYDPSADVWTPTSSINAPTGFGGEAVWTGSLMVVWGNMRAKGARYDPISDIWTPTSTGRSEERIPIADGHVAVWTGSRMIVWGGYNEYFPKAGGRYDPVTDSWTPTSLVNAPGGRSGALGVWTGDAMLVWGGYAQNAPDDAGLYDPVSDSWRRISIPRGIDGDAPAAWAGDVLIVQGQPYTGEHFEKYDLRTDTWTRISSVGAPDIMARDASVWTGEEVILWKTPLPASGAGSRYNPATDTWAGMSTTGAPGLIVNSTAVWTGSEMLVWGSRAEAGGAVTDGGRYDPVTDQWSPLSQSTFLLPRAYHSAAWTGSEMVIWGGWSLRPAVTPGMLNDGGRYDPVTDSWRPTTTVAAPPPLALHTAVWTGDAMLVWGRNRLTYGGRYYPSLRRDDDGDGFTACEGDCNEADAAVNPDGVELPGNAVDENCDGVVACDPGRAWKSRGELVSCITRECHAAAGAGRVSNETCKALIEAIPRH